jgi:hypothetical protein
MSAPVRFAVGTVTDGIPKTLKITEAVPPVPSVAVNVYGPGVVPEGITYGQENVPEVVEVPEQAVTIPQTIFMLLRGANPPAEKETEEPAVAPGGVARK